MHSCMLLLSHALAVLIVLAVLGASEPNPFPAVVSLPAPSRAADPARLTARPVIQQTTAPEVEHDLLPYVLISTIDGALHAVDRDGGKVRWTLKEGVEPLVGGAIRGQAGGEEYIVEPLSGSLYVFDSEGEGEEEAPKVRKLPLSVEQLIELSPFTFPHSPSRIFTGSKHTSLISIDLRTGQQVDCFSSLASNRSAADQCMCENDQLLDDMDGRSRSNRDTLFVGRTDYRLTIHSPSGSSAAFIPSASGSVNEELRTGSGIQEITYSTYTPNTFDKPLADYWAKAGAARDLWEDDGTVAKRMRVELGHDGKAVGVEQGGGVKWVNPLGSVGIAVYDILLPLTPSTARPILVPQPPPHLPSLFPAPSEPLPSHLDVLSKPPTTYIGTVPFPLALPPAPLGETADNDSQRDHHHHRSPAHEGHEIRRPTSQPKPLFYALSSTSYPLIHFAPPPRPGTLANGSFLLSDDMPDRDQLLPYLIDPPEEEKGLIPVSSDTALIEYPRIRVKDQASKGWWWWLAGVLSALLVSGIAVFNLNRRATAKDASDTGIASEKTHLLNTQTIVKSETARLVTFVEPVVEKSEADGSVDAEGAPKKKSTRRRVRGKKKKDGASNGSEEKSLDGEGDEAGDDDERDDSPGPTGRTAAAKKDKAEKPLPDLPREISSTDLKDHDDKERLAISDTVIGYGSHGTVVLKGTWGGRPVAVKRLLSDFTRLASHEVKLLQASDDHPNVIRYYCQEKRDNFLYIALDLCQASLADLVEAPDRHLELASALDRKKALVQITSGVRHLHEMKIIHRDIKPQNVLVSRMKDGSLRMLVSDFGLARRLDHDQSSFAPTANNAAGSLGWRAPECIRGVVRLNEGFERDPSATSHSSPSTSSSSSLIDLADGSDDSTGRCASKTGARLTKAVDLFALGCLYFWVLMSGEHPYGETYDRESNIVKGDAVNMAMLDILGEEGTEAKELIGSMLSMGPQDRPTTKECLGHPYFWSAAKRLSFLCDASDRFEIMENDPPEPTLVLLEKDAVSVVGKDWFSRADKLFTSNLGKYRKYKGNSVKDLLRAMRNKKHHYQDLDPGAKRLFGSLPTGFLHYFTSRYPSLFMHVYRVIKESRLQKEAMFDQYFQDGSS